jgi:uncharacterized protein (DUF4415 family)
MTRALLKELAAIEAMSDREIDTSDIPECLDWSNAEVGKFYRPIKTQISLRVDADILHWFKAKGKKYTAMMNQALRAYIAAEEIRIASRKSTSKPL